MNKTASVPFMDKIKAAFFSKKRYEVTVVTHVFDTVVHTRVSVVAYSKARAMQEAEQMTRNNTRHVADKANFINKVYTRK